VRQTDPHHGERPEKKERAVCPAWAKPIAEPSSKKPRQNSKRYRRDDSISDLRFRQPQVVAHHRHQGSYSEPRDETHKERKPREVKRTHRCSAEVQQTDPSSFAVGVRV
jgi:hypothetical protein